MEDYLPILRSLANAGVQFAAIGTWALKVYFPAEMADYELHDCDVVLAPDLENVRAAIRVLNAAGWETGIWGECVDTTISAQQLQGKYYVRANVGELTLDLTYECAIPWAEMQREIMMQLDIPLASLTHILHLKRLKASLAGNAVEVEAWLAKVGIQ